jgi:hypothetical protein
MRGTGLAGFSILFAIVAGAFLFIGYSRETTVFTDGGEIANLQMLHLQSLDFAIAIGAAVISAILAIGSAIVAAINLAWSSEEPG